MQISLASRTDTRRHELFKLGLPSGIEVFVDTLCVLALFVARHVMHMHHIARQWHGR